MVHRAEKKLCTCQITLGHFGWVFPCGVERSYTHDTSKDHYSLLFSIRWYSQHSILEVNTFDTHST